MDLLLAPLCALALAAAAAVVSWRMAARTVAAGSLRDKAVLGEQVRGLELRLQEVRGERDRARGDLLAAQRETERGGQERARLETQLSEAGLRAAEQAQLLERAEARFREAFQALSADALKSNNQAFLDLARSVLGQFQQGARTDLEARQQAIDQLLAPVRDSLGKFDSAIQGLEKERLGAYSVLKEQVQALREGQASLQAETSSLVRALRAPTTRGRWGEIQLRKVVEMAGMVANCDFTEQPTLEAEEGRLRPDVIVHLPGQKTVVIDAKVPLNAYLDAREAGDDGDRRTLIREHARQFREHVSKLGSKAYWDPLDGSPDFVVMFVPLESAFGAALEVDPQLIDYAWERSVLLAGPLTLLAHLKAAAYGWRQERVAANTRAISELGKMLYDRLRTMGSHFAGLGSHLEQSVRAYNATVASLESRVLVPARKFKDLGAATGDDLPEAEMVDQAPRGAQSPELQARPKKQLGLLSGDLDATDRPPS